MGLSAHQLKTTRFPIVCCIPETGLLFWSFIRHDIDEHAQNPFIHLETSAEVFRRLFKVFILGCYFVVSGECNPYVIFRLLSALHRQVLSHRKIRFYLDVHVHFSLQHSVLNLRTDLAEFEKYEGKVDLQKHRRKSATNMEVRCSYKQWLITRQLVADLCNDLAEDQHVLQSK